MDEQTIRDFIQRWSNSGGAERADYRLFLAELCDVLQAARPEPTVEDDCRNACVFERNVQFNNLDGTHTTRRIDLYQRGCFVFELCRCQTPRGWLHFHTGRSHCARSGPRCRTGKTHSLRSQRAGSHI